MAEQPSLFDEDALERARRVYFARIEGGKPAACPCCDRVGRVYRRKLHSEMAAFLVRLVRRTEPGEWIHIRDVVDAGAKATTDGAYLKHWHLIEKADADEDGPRGGLYRTTARGREFVEDVTRTEPSHVVLYNNEVLAFDDDRPATILDALGSRFSYEELMRESARGVTA